MMKNSRVVLQKLRLKRSIVGTLLTLPKIKNVVKVKLDDNNVFTTTRLIRVFQVDDRTYFQTKNNVYKLTLHNW